MKFTAEQLLNVLDECYKKALNGFGPLKGSVEVGDEYLKKQNGNKEKAIKDLIKIEQVKCTADGFVTSLGGFATLVVGLPANIASVLLIQIRLVIAIAYISGYDVENDSNVKLKVYACMAGLVFKDFVKDTLVKQIGTKVMKKAGIEVAKNITIKATEKAIFSKVPMELAVKMNYAVGAKLATKFSAKGLSALAKAIPILGGIVGGSLDFLSTKSIAKISCKLFLTKENDISDEEIQKIIEETQNENEMA